MVVDKTNPWKGNSDERIVALLQKAVEPTWLPHASKGDCHSRTICVVFLSIKNIYVADLPDSCVALAATLAEVAPHRFEREKDGKHIFLLVK